MAETQVRLLISGQVQGVGFRFAAQDEARRLGVAGWIRNLADGQVEVLVEGEEELVARMLEWCHRGPPGARVQRVEEQRAPARGEFRDFSIAPTAR